MFESLNHLSAHKKEMYQRIMRNMHSAGGEMSLETGRQASDMLEFFKGNPVVSIELYHSRGTFLSELVPLHF